MDTAQVSIVTAAYAPDAAYLEQAYDSLRVQTVGWEWLIQLDAVGTVPEPLLREAQISVATNEERLGAAATRNRALVRARAAHVLSLDADDALLDGALAALTSALETEPRAAYAFGGVARMLPDGTVERRPYRWFAPGLVAAGTLERIWRHERTVPVTGGAVMWRRDVLFAYGGWAGLSGSEDTAPLLAAAASYDGVYVGCDVLLQRTHALQTSATPEYASACAVNWQFVDARLRALRALGR